MKVTMRYFTLFRALLKIPIGAGRFGGTFVVMVPAKCRDSFLCALYLAEWHLWLSKPLDPPVLT